MTAWDPFFDKYFTLFPDILRRGMSTARCKRCRQEFAVESTTQDAYLFHINHCPEGAVMEQPQKPMKVKVNTGWIELWLIVLVLAVLVVARELAEIAMKLK